MSAVLIDSNVLIDLATRSSQWYSWSAAAVSDASSTSRVVINPVIYAEVSIVYQRVEEVDDALPAEFFDREPVPYEAAFLAGKAYLAYRRRRGARHSPLPDFFIGAHAAVAKYSLLTRDPSRYRTYFPTVRLIAP